MLHRRLDLKITPPRLFSVAQGVALFVWDQSGALTAERGQLRLGGEPPPPPVVRAVLPTRWNLERSLLAVHWPMANEADRLEITDKAGQLLGAADLPTTAEIEPFSVEALLAGLTPEGRLRLARFLLDTCRVSFKLGQDPKFAAALSELVTTLNPEPGLLRSRLRLPGAALLCSTVVPVGAGRILSALAVGERRIVELPVKPEADAERVRQGRLPLHLVLPRLPGGAVRVALLAEGGLLVRQLAGDAAPPADTVAWLGSKPAEAERAMAVRYLQARAAAGDATAGALATEIGLFAPRPAIAVTDPALPVGGGIDLAIDDTSGHAFLSGWLRDPLGLVERIDAGGATVHTVARPDLAERLKLRSGADIRSLRGFVVRVPGSAQLTDVALQLRSGTRLRLRPPMRAMAPSAARDAVLAALPATLASDAILADTILPAAEALNAAHLATRGTPEVLDIGAQPEKPAASIIVPLYRNLEFLPFQVAAFAMDRSLREAELIYVLDSPEQRPDVEIALRHLAAIYAVPMRLVVPSNNFGYAAANNAGAAVARGEVLALLNSDVVPEGPGWLPALAAPLEVAGIGASGARLLFDDSSLQHAGLHFAADDRGVWRNRHFFKGLPRDFAPATQARIVPALTGACLVLRREVYERLGGFDEGYLVGDYEDSDLCLRLAAEGLDCWYEPRATLLHLERQSVPLHGAHARGLASECNRVRHAARWQAAMEEAMRRFERGAAAADPSDASPQRASRSRRKGRN